MSLWACGAPILRQCFSTSRTHRTISACMTTREATVAGCLAVKNAQRQWFLNPCPNRRSKWPHNRLSELSSSSEQRRGPPFSLHKCQVPFRQGRDPDRSMKQHGHVTRICSPPTSPKEIRQRPQEGCLAASSSTRTARTYMSCAAYDQVSRSRPLSGHTFADGPVRQGLQAISHAQPLKTSGANTSTRTPAAAPASPGGGHASSV